VTTVIGRKFGERIVVMSDTRISDRNSTVDNIIPGRLKVIAIAPFFTVAYAGHADPALGAIRSARIALLADGENAALDLLRQCTARRDVDVSFLVVTHHPARLRRVSNGNVSDPGEGFALGDVGMVSLVAKEAVAQQARLRGQQLHGHGHVTEEEALFRNAFLSVLGGGNFRGLEGVGGIPIDLLGSPYGHTYCGGTYVHAWDTINSAVGVTPEMQAARNTGQTQFGFNVIGPRLRGVGVLAVVLSQAAVGWVYNPIRDDEAVLYHLTSRKDQHGGYGPMLEEMVAILDIEASAFGGGIEDQ
jgi:hypothetical protein